jgi:type II secretory pathway component PulC
MIEDTSVNKTYILNKGDSINGVLIKDIFKDRVILSYQGEEMVMM